MVINYWQLTKSALFIRLGDTRIWRKESAAHAVDTATGKRYGMPDFALVKERP